MPDAPAVSVVGIPQPDGSTVWWELTDVWRVKKVDPPASNMATDVELADAITTHANLPNAHHPANVGVSGSKVVGGFRLTFTNGLLTGFEPV